MPALFDLGGEIALVTGASFGIGRRIAVALARAGARVVLLARRRAALDDVAAAIADGGGEAAALEGDLGRYREHGALAALAGRAGEAFGAPSILVNAAGVNLREPADAISVESWERTLGLNLAVPFFLARELVPPMRARGRGKIINLASLQSARAFANGIAYGASKGGVAQLTRAMAEAWSRDGIGCNAIAPGFFPTELTAPVFGDAGAARRLAAQTAIGRNGELADLDGVAVFFASRASDYVTGQVLYVDGGFTAK